MPQHWTLAFLRRTAQHAFLAVMALALVASAARAGVRYYDCAMMGEQRAEPCCGEPERAPDDRAILDAACGCCQVRLVAPLPDARAASGASVPPTPLVAMLAPELLSPHPLGDLRFSRSPNGDARAGPPLPRERSKLMVFLI